MAGPGIKISTMTTANPLTGVELVPVVQSGETRQSTVTQVYDYLRDQVAVSLSSLDGRVSALETSVSGLTVGLASTDATVSGLVIQVAAVSAVTSVNSASITSINSTITSVNAAITSVNAAHTSVVGSLTSVNTAITSINAAHTSTNGVLANVSALVSVLTSALVSVNSAHTSTNAAITSVNAAITSVNAVVVAVSAQVSVLTSAVTSINAAHTSVVSAITSINAFVSLKVNRAGDTLTGPLILAADASVSLQAVTKQQMDAGDVWVKLFDTAMTAVATVQFTLPAGYRAYEVQFIDIKSASTGAGVDFYMRSYVGGVLKNGASDYFCQGPYTTGTTGNFVNSTYSFAYITANGQAATPEETAGRITITPGSASARGSIVNHGVRHVDTANARAISFVQTHLPAGLVSDLLFGWVGGTNFAATGRIVVMGLKA